MSNEARKVPTRPGWWVGQRNAAAPRHTDNPEPHPVAVTMRGGKLCVGTTPVADPHWTWFAEIPGPAVLAALAEYSAAFMARDNDARAGGSYANGEVRRERIAADALHDAIRAERDGAV